MSSLMKFRRATSAFTLIELMTVIGIILLIAALAAPILMNFRKGDAMLAATRQMLDAIHRGRQLAISQHTTVHMIFAPTNLSSQNIYVSMGGLGAETREAMLNVLEKEQTGYAYVCFRSVGDQPGRGTPRYLSSWQTLPDSTFIPSWKFNLTGIQTRFVTNFGTREVFTVGPFDQVANVPFPSERAYFGNPALCKITLPCLTFDYQGRLATVSGQPLGHDEYIPLAHGSVLPPRNPETKVPVLGVPSEMESPANNSTESFNLIHIDWLTGRARVERQEVQ